MVETIINYFDSIPSLHRAIILVGGITFFWMLEGSIPLFKFSYNKLKHSIPNFFFTFTTILINFSLAFLLLKSSDWVSNNNFGLIHLYSFPFWIKTILGILLLDLVGAYLAHYVEHNVKPLWMIHLVHHSDHKVDTTTANRHHPLESLIRFIFTVLGIFVSGVPIGVVMLYQSLSIISTQFTHANIKLSKKLDRIISYIFVSPDMHKIHHHYRLPYTDKNYGNIFSIWDRIFGTFIYYEREKIKYGVDVFPSEDKNKQSEKFLYRKLSLLKVDSNLYFEKKQILDHSMKLISCKLFCFLKHHLLKTNIIFCLIHQIAFEVQLPLYFQTKYIYSSFF